ncbi:MAG TPA: PspC domain-containing protein [Bacteroidetes bacterium]|nr:PspC domain-containing protein [Bacteroidota bacterium]
MKKTITINLGGMVFHIDEDAYQMLHEYLQAVGKHYAEEGASSEILEDIEARMAELFRERITNSGQVITRALTEEIIGIMGYPEDFMEEPSPRESHRIHRTRYRRIYRDPDNRILGGVCGGLGAYFNVDPLVFRILFIAITLVGGAGVLIYLILWIVVPEARTIVQKLEMRGEAVNVSNIGKKVKEEFDQVKENMKNVKNKMNI